MRLGSLRILLHLPSSTTASTAAHLDMLWQRAVRPAQLLDAV